MRKWDIFDALQTLWLMILCMIWWSFTLGGNWNSVKSTTAKHLLTALQSVLDLIAYSNTQLADSSSFHDMDAKLCFYTVLNRIKINHNSENTDVEVQSLLNRFPNLKDLILQPKIFSITKESPILPLNFDGNPYLVKVGFFGWHDFLSEDNCVYR